MNAFPDRKGNTCDIEVRDDEYRDSKFIWLFLRTQGPLQIIVICFPLLAASVVAIHMGQTVSCRAESSQMLKLTSTFLTTAAVVAQVGCLNLSSVDERSKLYPSVPNSKLNKSGSIAYYAAPKQYLSEHRQSRSCFCVLATRASANSKNRNHASTKTPQRENVLSECYLRRQYR